MCPELPPAPAGGIGTYTLRMARLLAAQGDTVHVIGPRWKDAETSETSEGGRLVVYRVPFQRWRGRKRWRPHPDVRSEEARALFISPLRSHCFSWQACLLAERLIEEEAIDVIEAQEYEAPLYYLQLRRALGLGPARRPPCIVHLHSPSELIAEHNDWDSALPAVVAARRVENYSIRAADALLSPSRFLARQVGERLGLAAGGIEVIPYPALDLPHIERPATVWEQGGVLYVGRLEPRKGVLEWIDAAVAVAREFPEARFDFVGANILGPTPALGERAVAERVPGELRAHFRMHGAQPHGSLPSFLSRARMAVVPSRWDNFPYTCVEAMMSGLPVLATAMGGMPEMIDDGENGWIAPAADRQELTAALRRALRTSSERLADMGRRSAASIRSLCDPVQIVERQQRFRGAVIAAGSGRSGELAPHLPGTRVPRRHQATPRRSEPRDGLAVIEARATDGRGNGGQGEGALYPGEGAAVKNAAVEAVRSRGASPTGFVFMGPGDRLLPGFLAQCEGIFANCPEVGVVNCWVRRTGSTGCGTPPCPEFPYQWLWNDLASFSAVRAEAFDGVGGFRPNLEGGFENWDLFNAIMAEGWVGVTIPEILAETASWSNSARSRALPGHGMRARIVRRFPELVAADGLEIALLARPAPSRLLREAASVATAHFAASAAAGGAAARTTGGWRERCRWRLRRALFTWLSIATFHLLLGKSDGQEIEDAVEGRNLGSRSADLRRDRRAEGR